MSNYEDLIEFRNKLTNDSDYTIYEEDCQLLDRVLDDYQQFVNQLHQTNIRIVEEMNLSEERRRIIENLTIENNRLQQQLENAKKIIASDISPALSNAINTIGNAIANSLDEPTIIDLVKRIEQDQTQLAIQELEKVKDFICDYSEITGQAWSHTLRFLNNQIKELKGE